MSELDALTPAGAERRHRPNGARAVLAVVLVLQLVLAGYGLAKAKAQPSLPRPAFDRVTPASGSVPLTPESGLPLASQYAKQWKSDARLVTVTMHLNWPEEAAVAPVTDLPPDGFLMYLFVSGDQVLSINLDRGSGNLNGTVVSRQGGDVWHTLDLSSFAKSSTIAGLTAEVISGTNYRNACPDLRDESDVSATVLSKPDGTTEPAWTVTYQQEHHNDQLDVVVRLDAVSGNVIENDVRPRDCSD